MKIGNFEFYEGDLIHIGAYTFRIKNSKVWLQKISIRGGLGYVDFETGIFLMLIQSAGAYLIEKENK